MAEQVHSANKYYGTQLLLEDAKYRATHQKNIIASVGGQQGTGKSLWSICFALNLGKIFGNPFDVENNIYANPFDLHEDLYSSGTRRKTYLYDEQPVYRAGIGSGAIGFALKNYEDICRKTQNNLIYCSPEVLDHSHYFVFEQIRDDPTRIVNATCRKCPKYDECVALPLETLCSIPFNEREGYPIEFSFLLKTKRLNDEHGREMPRLIITLPMITPKLALEYEKVKNRNIENFETYQNKTSSKMQTRIKEFVKENQSNLLKSKFMKGIRVYSTQPKLLIKSYFLEHFGRSRFVDQEAEMWVLRAKSILEKKAEIKNERNYKIFLENEETRKEKELQEKLLELEIAKQSEKNEKFNNIENH